MIAHFFKKILDQKGQAMFELILFLPFLMFLYTIYYTVGNSISGSINQQKAVRGIYYSFVKGNSYIINYAELKYFKSQGFAKIGFSSLGWADHLENQRNPFAPCFKFSSLLRNNSTEECNSNQREEEKSSRFIRTFTYYGVCGPLYSRNNLNNDFFEIHPQKQSSTDSCTSSK